MNKIWPYTLTLSLMSGCAFGFAAESFGVAIGTISGLWYFAFVIRGVEPGSTVRGEQAQRDSEQDTHG